MRARLSQTFTVTVAALGMLLATTAVVIAQGNDPTRPTATSGIPGDAG